MKNKMFPDFKEEVEIMTLKNDIKIIKINDDLQFNFLNKTYTIKNIPKLLTEKLNVFIKVDWDNKIHIDNLNLISSNARERFIDKIIKKFNLDYPESIIIEDELVQILEYIEKILEENKIKYSTPQKIELSEQERKEAIKYAITGKDYLDKIIYDMDKLGFVGEYLNKKICILSAISRKLDHPLSCIMKSRASAGKSKLLEIVCEFTPDEDVKRITRLTPQALYYNQRDGLKHKLFAIEEHEGINGADYVIRSMQSSNMLMQITTTKDPNTGKLTSTEHIVEGPMSIIMTTTNPTINFENETRCFILTMDESEEQTKKIFKQLAYFHTKEGYDELKKTENLKKIHQNFQRTLKPLKVFNPYSEQLSFPSRQLHTRRLRNFYKGLIEVIAFINQHKKEIKKDKDYEYIEVEPEDILKANELMTEIMEQSLHDLSKPSFQLVKIIKDMVESKCNELNIKPNKFEFTRRIIREYSGWSDFQIKTHISELVDLEYIRHKCGKQGKKYIYELTSTPNDFGKHILSNNFDKTSKLCGTSNNQTKKLKVS